MPPIKPRGEIITIEEIQEQLSKVPVTSLAETKKFIDSDHWQNGKGWIGFMPDKTSPTYIEDMEAIEKSFTAKNIILGILKRLKGAVIGNEPDFDIAKKQTSDQSTTQKDTAITDWWERKQIHEKLQLFMFNKAAYGKSSMRFCIPRGYLTDSEGKLLLNTSKWEDILSKIYLVVPTYSRFINLRDVNFGTDFTLFEIESDSLNKEQESKEYEVHYLDENSVAVIRHLTTTDGLDSIVKTDLNGSSLSFTVGEYEEALITTTVKQMQRAVNHAKTMEGFSLRNINFPETVFLNADLPEEKKTVNGKEESVLTELIRGVGRWIGLQGVSYGKADGSEAIIPADIKWREGADPEKFAKVAENNSKDIHEEVGMLYVFLADNPYPSGESRIEAMTDYLILLIDYKTLCDKAGRWVIETPYRLAKGLAKQPIDDVTFLFSTKLTLGRISVADKTLMLEEVNSRLRSRRNYQILVGISDDPEKEDSIILEEIKNTELQPPSKTPSNISKPNQGGN